MNIPKSIKIALAVREHDSKWLYTEMEMSQGWLSMVLNGDRELSMGALQKICDVLEMEVSHFIGLGEE